MLKLTKIQLSEHSLWKGDEIFFPEREELFRKVGGLFALT